MSKETLVGIAGVFGLLCIGSLAGATVALYVMPQKVTQVIQPKTYQVIKTIETKVENKEVPPKSCLDGQDGIVVNGHSEQVSTATRDNPDNWDYMNIITFNVNGVNRICYWEGTQDLASNFVVGQKYHPVGGTPM